MKSSLRTSNPVLLLMLGVLAAAVGYQAAGQAGAKAPPTAVAVVKLDVLMSQLTERAAAEAELKVMADEITKELERRQAMLQAYGEQVEAAVDPAERSRLEDEALLFAKQFQAWQAFKANEMDAERAIRFQALYASIKQAISTLAAAAGYDVVIVDDSSGAPQIDPNAQTPREVQIRNQILNRRVLYSDARVDITKQLVTRMNNTFNAGG